MFDRILEKFIDVDEILGKGDELSGVLELLIADGSITEKRAYEIKEQMTKECNEGKIQKKGMTNRLTYLKNDIDFPHKVGILRETLSGEDKLCPYCFQIVDEKSDFCNICGYDLIHDEELNLDGVKIVDSIEELDISPIEAVVERLRHDDILEEDDEEEIPPLTEIINNLSEDGITSIHSFDNENSILNNPDIDLFRVINYMNEGYTFDDACDEIYINSKLTKQGLKDLAVRKNFITPNDEIKDDGYEFVINNEWMYFYRYYLESFNFDDFEAFYKENSFKVEDAGIEFVNKHICIAEEKKDYQRLIDSYKAKGHIYDHLSRYNKSLRYELKVFILKLNPIYLNEEELKMHIPLDDYNIDTLCNFHSVYSLSQIKKSFNKEWKKINFEKIYINRKKSWEILLKLFKGEDVEKYSDEISEKYFS